jgi:hypothetical protein
MKLIVTLMIYSFFLGVFPPVLGAGRDIDLTIEGETLSAKFRKVPLKIILEKLERDKGIWFRGESSLLEEEVTVQFTGLPFEGGLKRILASTNHSLMYDGNERLIGVIVIGKGKADHDVSKGRAGTSKRTIPAPGRNERTDVNRALSVMRNNLHRGDNVKIGTEERENFRAMSVSPSSGDPVESTEQEPEDFGAIKNSPPPGGPIEGTGKERENFMVIKDSPPPGGPVESTEQGPENFRVIRNTPPPGGPVEVSPEKLENFKVIKNCPPPGS